MAFELKEVLEWTSGTLVNGGDVGDRADRIRIERAALKLGEAKPDEVAFFFSKDYQDQLPGARPGILITGKPFVEPLKGASLRLWTESAVVACDDPYWAMAVLTRELADRATTMAHVGGAKSGGIHPSAVVSDSAKISDRVAIGPGCVVEDGAEIGEGTILYPSCYVGKGTKIGKECVLFHRVSVYEAVMIGDRCRFHAGAVIGSDGFGYAQITENGKVTGHQKIYHMGRVRIGSDVEIGSNSTVDRGTFDDTVIADQVKLDNLVHIGHNAKLETGAIVCGGTCLAGHAEVGPFAFVGGLVGITNKVRVGAGAKVAACSLVSKDVEPGEVAAGNPQRSQKEHFRVHAYLNKSALRKKK